MSTKFELAKKILQDEKKISAELLAYKLGVAMPTAYNIYKLLKEWCAETKQCEEVKEGRRSMLVWKNENQQEQQLQYKLIEKNDKVEIYDVPNDVDLKEFYEKTHGVKTEVVEQSKDGKIVILDVKDEGQQTK